MEKANKLPFKTNIICPSYRMRRSRVYMWMSKMLFTFKLGGWRSLFLVWWIFATDEKLISCLCLCLCSIKFLLWITKSTIIIINNDFINKDFCLCNAQHRCEFWLLPSIECIYTIHVAYTSLMWYFKKKIEIPKSFYFEGKHKFQQNFPSHERVCAIF